MVALLVRCVFYPQGRLLADLAGLTGSQGPSRSLWAPVHKTTFRLCLLRGDVVSSPASHTHRHASHHALSDHTALGVVGVLELCETANMTGALAFEGTFSRGPGDLINSRLSTIFLHLKCHRASTSRASVGI